MAHPTSTQPEAMRLADELCEPMPDYATPTRLEAAAAAELRRLHELNQAMLEALIDIKYGLEGARIWGGMEWTYNPLHPFKYLPLVEKASAAIAKATGGQA